MERFRVYLKTVMQEEQSYSKDTNDFLNKINNINGIPENAISMAGDVVALYPCIPHQVDLETLCEALDKRERHKVPAGKLVKMAEFVLRNKLRYIGDSW